MWLSRNKSVNSAHTSPSRRSNFNRHSLKSIDDLLIHDDKNASTTDHPKPKPKPKPKSKPKPKPKPSSPIPQSTAKKHSVFHRVCLANQFTRSISPNRSKPILNKSQSQRQNPKQKQKQTVNNEPPKRKPEPPAVNLPGSEHRVVVYMTSLGAVRPTFDACRAVRSILQGFRVAVDERDLSMDSSYREELEKVMLPENKVPALPRVFIGGRYVGDAEDVRRLNEAGELKKMVERLPAVSRGVCAGCGDFRFVICGECDGSRKCYREDQKGVFRRCIKCNKNGLIRCSTCWTGKVIE